MAAPALEEIQHDTLAMSVAGALALANETATTRGINLPSSIVTITEESPPPERQWRIHYGPRDYANQRGGDLIVIVHEQSGSVSRIIRGQ